MDDFGGAVEREMDVNEMDVDGMEVDSDVEYYSGDCEWEMCVLTVKE